MNVALLHPKSEESGGIAAPVTKLSKLLLGDLDTDAQVRLNFDPEGITSLADSLKTQGQIVPILAYWDAGRGKHIIIDGERRFRAAKEGGIETLEALVFPFQPTEQEIALVQLTIDLQREGLGPIERANGFDRVLKANGWNASELARFIGKPVSTVTRATDLLILSPEFQEMITKGTLPTNIARELARLPEEQRPHAWKQIQDAGLNGNGAQKFVTKLLKPKAKSRRPKAKDKHTYKLSGFEAVVTPKKITLTPTANGKPRTREQMITAVELLLARMRDELANAAQAPNGEPVEQHAQAAS